MTYDELRIFILEEIDWYGDQPYVASLIKYLKSNLAVVELHRPTKEKLAEPFVVDFCHKCKQIHPCETIEAIEKELK